MEENIQDKTEQLKTQNIKDILAFGQTTITKLHKLKIIVYGLESLGVEICKNIGGMNPQELLVLDDSPITKHDQSQCFLYRPKELLNKQRQKTCVEGLKQIYPELKVETWPGDYHHPEQLIQPQVVAKYDLVIITQCLHLAPLYALNIHLRAQKKPTGLIYGQILGGVALIINDFGKHFKVFDKDGVEPTAFLIQHISKEQQGVVTIHKDKKHNYRHGDFVRISEVEGMVEVNGNDTRPIRVLDDYSFSIEDTREFSDYQKGGLVELAKVPLRLDYRTLQQELEGDSQVLDFQELFNRNYLLHYQTQLQPDIRYAQLKLGVRALFHFYHLHQQLPSTLQHYNEVYQYANKLYQQQQQQQHSDNLKDNVDTSKQKEDGKQNVNGIENDQQEQQQYEQIKEDMIFKLCMFSDIKLCIMSQLLGAVMSMEIMKFLGKFQPIRGVLLYDILDTVEQDIHLDEEDWWVRMLGSKVKEELEGIRLTVVGAGTTGAELLKSLTLMGVATHQHARIDLLDQDLVKPNNIDTHFYFNKQYINQLKSSRIKTEMNLLNPQVNINAFREKVCLKINQQKNNQVTHYNLKDWQQSDYIIGCLDKTKSLKALKVRAIQCHKKVLLAQTNTFDCQVEHILPFKYFQLEQKEVCYDDSYDHWQQEERDVVVIPFLQQQLIQWSHQIFFSIFDRTQKFFRQVKEDKLDSLRIDDFRKDLECRVKVCVISKVLQQHQQFTSHTLVGFGIQLFFYLFVHQIQSIIQKYPKNHQVNNQFFWSGYRRFPNILEYDITDESFVNFVGSCANLLAIIFDQEDKLIIDKQKLISMIKLQCLEQQEENKEWDFTSFSDQQVEETLIKINQLKSQNNLQEIRESLKTKQLNLFENLAHKNQFLDFMTSATNLKAKCFYLQEIPRYKMEKITFDMNRNVVLVHSFIAAQTIIQLIKNLKHKTEDLCDGTFNMVESKFEHKSILEGQKKNGIWDQTIVDQKLTLKELIKQFVKEEDSIYIMNLEDICVVNHHEKIDRLSLDDNQEKYPDQLLNQLANIQIWELKDHIIISLISLDKQGNKQFYPLIKYLNTNKV